MNSEYDAHSVHFSHFAARLERHLTRNGISCHDADLIIEESSVLYFETLRSAESRIIKFLRKQDPADLFVDSACRAIKKLLPEAESTFGSRVQVEECIR